MGKPYGKACDWWSLGALAYDLLTGSPPFKANNHAKVQDKIVKQKLTLPYFLGRMQRPANPASAQGPTQAPWIQHAKGPCYHQEASVFPQN